MRATWARRWIAYKMTIEALVRSMRTLGNRFLPQPQPYKMNTGIIEECGRLDSANKLATPRKRLLDELRGQSFRLPDLDGLLKGWPMAINSNIDWLRDEVHDRLRTCAITSSLSQGSVTHAEIAIVLS